MYTRRSSSKGNRGGSRNNNSRGRYRGGGRSRGRTPQINISAFIEKAKQNQQQISQVAPIEVTRTFADFQLHNQVHQNLDRLGFTKPTPIQDQTIELVAQGRNVLGIANTGTGKTGAFLIPLINQLLQNPEQKILVVAPTRELAVQINTSFRQLTVHTHLYSVQCIGGASLHRQIQHLSKNYQAVIGTPGRLIDLVDRRKIKPAEFTTVVLDEVDRMLDMGFVRDIRQLLAATPADRQSLYFSATISPEIERLINDFSENVAQVSVKTNQTADSVEQDIIRLQGNEQKVAKLEEILNREEVTKVLVFGRTKRGVKKLMFELRDRGFSTDSIHGNKSQSQRQRALQDFKQDKVNVLVATDVAARGLDIDDVSHVINYEVPDTFDDYIHRIGRTGRGGKRGVAYTFVQ